MAFGGLFGYSAASQALTYSCPDASLCNGNLYAVDLASLGGTSYQATVSIDVTNSYTGNQWSDVVNSIQLKDFAPSFTNAVLTGAPTALSDWTSNSLELGAGGCSGGSGNKVCIGYTGGSPFGVGFTGGDILTWTFTFDAASVYDTAHLKYLYLDGAGDSTTNKVGSLGSFTIGENVPEPATPALMGLGLLMLGFMSRRRKGRG